MGASGEGCPGIITWQKGKGQDDCTFSHVTVQWSREADKKDAVAIHLVMRQLLSTKEFQSRDQRFCCLFPGTHH